MPAMDYLYPLSGFAVGAGTLGVATLFFLHPKLSAAHIVGSDVAHAVPLTLVAGPDLWMFGGVDRTRLDNKLVFA